ncbi:hypothetical protein [Bernardetia sp.]|uniref:hypothetical protein n=1 Tax=Bernardetia sp. TaxID=1937974 RepID=UPI0025C2A391|nr:hypothetical protein [Bernardetia sp.]
MDLEQYREYYKKRVEEHSESYNEELMKVSYKDYKDAIADSACLTVCKSKYVWKIIHRMNVALPSNNEVALFVMPSFEYYFYLKIDKDGITKTSIADNLNPKTCKTDIVKRAGENIDVASLNYLISSITKAVKEAKDTDRTTMGLDGTNYYFIANIENQVVIGEKWSPYKESNVGKLLSKIQQYSSFVFYDFGDEKKTIRVQ